MILFDHQINGHIVSVTKVLLSPGMFQRDGSDNGTIDLQLTWQYTYIPPKASTKTPAQVTHLCHVGLFHISYYVWVKMLIENYLVNIFFFTFTHIS